MLHNLQAALCAASRCRDVFRSAVSSDEETFILGFSNIRSALQHVFDIVREIFIVIRPLTHRPSTHPKIQLHLLEALLFVIGSYQLRVLHWAKC